MADNNTTIDAIRDWQRGPLGFVGTLPTFDDDPSDDNGARAEASDALRVIPPFAPTDSDL